VAPQRFEHLVEENLLVRTTGTRSYRGRMTPFWMAFEATMAAWVSPCHARVQRHVHTAFVVYKPPQPPGRVTV
jgi:hypothetical protein